MKNKVTFDDLNDIASAAVDDIHGKRAPIGATEDDIDDWKVEGDCLFMIACNALTPDMDVNTASDRALYAVRSAYLVR